MSGTAAFATGRTRRRLRHAMPLLALGALLSSFCSAANAQSWQCHAPEGTYQNHDTDVPVSATQFTGEMRIKKAKGPGRWYPTARVAFTERDLAADGCHCNGVEAGWDPEHTDSFVISLLADGKKIPLGLVPNDKPVKFKLDFTWDGQLKLAVGTRVVTATSQTPMRDTLHMSCSTADVAFKIAVAPPIPHSMERCPFAAREQWTMEEIDRYCRAPG